ncbi:hypothetical protein HispidOSU_017944 [Sigmodon hispidus]
MGPVTSCGDLQREQGANGGGKIYHGFHMSTLRGTAERWVAVPHCSSVPHEVDGCAILYTSQRLNGIKSDVPGLNSASPPGPSPALQSLACPVKGRRRPAASVHEADGTFTKAPAPLQAGPPRTPDYPPIPKLPLIQWCWEIQLVQPA